MMTSSRRQQNIATMAYRGRPTCWRQTVLSAERRLFRRGFSFQAGGRSRFRRLSELIRYGDNPKPPLTTQHAEAVANVAERIQNRKE
jgi:hypothetical protein